MKLIKVDDKVWEKLMMMKIKNKKQSLNEVIKELIKCKKQSKQKL
ncbi:MAG: hypothetical protein AABX14_04585 [Candidatus Aenigmatarchaeota archaeon]